ncbi:MAG: hypothetical protein MSS69_08750 [Spirochaetales bacterium]|nr:hypothetical protein [Spirochaetales bacterium]
MNKNKLAFFMFILLFMALSLFVSCTDSITNDKGQLEIIEKPIIEEIEEAEGVRVISVSKASYILYKMEPLWSTDYGKDPYGSTIGLGVPKKLDGTELDSKYEDYKLITATSNSLGYFSQGKWSLEVDVLDENYNSLLSSIISKEIYLNTISSTVNIDLDNDMFSTSNTDFSLKIEDIKVGLVDSKNRYIESENELTDSDNKNGYRLLVSVKKLVADSTKDGPDVIDLIIPKSNITFLDNNGTENGTAVEGLINYEFANKFSKGSYSVTIRLQEYKNDSFVEAGGMTFSFIGIGGTEASITGSGNSLDLVAADYVTPGTGESGIIIDSGTDANVTIKTDLTAASTVTDATAVTFTGEVNGKATSGQWFVNGESKSSGSTFSYTPTGMSGKTVTITYMILDSSYNTISANYYLTVSAS